MAAGLKELCCLTSAEWSRLDGLSMMASSLFIDLLTLTDSNNSRFWPVVIAALWISLLILIYSICYFIYIIKLTQDYILFFRITMKILCRVWSTGIKTHLIWVDGVLGVILGHLDSTLNPLEMLLAYQRNEGGHPLDNPEKCHHSVDQFIEPKLQIL